MNINISKVSTYLSVLSVLLGAIIYSATWLIDNVATKDDMAIMYTELRLHQIQESLLTYQKQGIQNLSDMDKHRYETLVNAESTIIARRDSLLGLGQ